MRLIAALVLAFAVACLIAFPVLAIIGNNGSNVGSPTVQRGPQP